MKISIVLFILFSFFACQDDTQVKSQKNIQPEVEETIEEKIAHHVEAHLEIPATEKYSLETFSAQMNTDDSVDMIITVNLLDRAMEKAMNSTNLATRAESGYMGRYNFIFFFDGATKKISKEIPVPSSAMAKLKVDFEHIRSEAYFDVLVSYKLEDASFTRFFTIINRLPKETFEMMNYDGLGSKENKAYYVKYDDGSHSLAKDILVYKGKLEQIEFKDPKEVYSYYPKIEETGELDRKWFFNDNDLKYYTMKNQ